MQNCPGYHALGNAAVQNYHALGNAAVQNHHMLLEEPVKCPQTDANHAGARCHLPCRDASDAMLTCPGCHEVRLPSGNAVVLCGPRCPVAMLLLVEIFVGLHGFAIPRVQRAFELRIGSRMVPEVGYLVDFLVDFLVHLLAQFVGFREAMRHLACLDPSAFALC